MRRPSGFSLVEVMVASVILALGLSGLAGLLLGNVSGTGAAGNQTMGMLFAAGLGAEISSSPAAFDTYLSEPPQVRPDCDEAHNCTPAQFAQHNLKQWQIALALQMPGGTGLVCRDATPLDGDRVDPACDGFGPGIVKVFWRSPAGSSNADSERAVLELTP